MMAIIRAMPSLWCRHRPRALSTTSKPILGSWSSHDDPNSKLSSHERLIQSLRSSLKSSDSNSDTGNPERRGSLLGGFYNGGFCDHPEDRLVLEQLRKLELQYRKWEQIDKANEVSKQIIQMEAASHQRRTGRFSSGGPPSSAFSKPSTPSLSSDIFVESTGVNELIRQGYSEEAAMEKAVENAQARSAWVLGSLDPKKRSRWEAIRQQVISGDINFDDEKDTMASRLKPYLLEPSSDSSQELMHVNKRSSGQQVQPLERQRIVDELGRAYGTGRRKTSIARVWLTPITNKTERVRVIINGRHYLEYFTRIEHRFNLFEPLLVTQTYGQFNIRATVKGGGLSGQAGAMRLGVARALQNFNPEHRPVLKDDKLLTRDSRMVERKKAGKRKARASFPYVKR